MAVDLSLSKEQRRARANNLVLQIDKVEVAAAMY